MKNKEKVSTEWAKCQGCGANLRFDPASQKLVCDHCGTKVEISSKEIAKEHDILAGLSDDCMWQNDDSTAFRCANCGAEVVLSKSETAKNCPFCGTPYVEKEESLTGIKPNAVLPFTVSFETAKEKSKTWAKRKFFAPRKFKKTASSENLKGVYTPCFTFDSQTYSYYEGRLGRTHTTTSGSGKNATTHTYTEWFSVSGAYNEFFDDVLITAGEKFDQKRLNKVSPYDTNNSSAYDGKYLLGFMAYHYDREISDCWSSAKKIIDRVIRRSILSQYSYDVIDYLNISTHHERVTYKYVMLPVYVGHFEYRKKLYNFFVNGTTGKVAGKTPVSPLKVLLAVLIGVAVVVGGVLLFLNGA